MKDMHDPFRGSGRTTGLILQAISQALLSPGSKIIFRDHCQDVPAVALRQTIMRIAEHLPVMGLRFMDYPDGTVTVRAPTPEELRHLREETA